MTELDEMGQRETIPAIVRENIALAEQNAKLREQLLWMEHLRDGVLEDLAGWYERTGQMLLRSQVPSAIRGMKERASLVLRDDSLREGER